MRCVRKTPAHLSSQAVLQRGYGQLVCQGSGSVSSEPGGEWGAPFAPPLRLIAISIWLLPSLDNQLAKPAMG